MHDAQSTSVLHDEHAIKHVIVRYAQCVDRRDGAGFAALFAPGAILDAGEMQFTTRKALASVPGYLNVYAKTYHTLLNTLVLVDGHQATAVTYSAAHHLTPSGKNMHTDLIRYITYHDLFVKQDQWRFAHRRVDQQFTQTILVEDVS